MPWYSLNVGIADVVGHQNTTWSHKFRLKYDLINSIWSSLEGYVIQCIIALSFSNNTCFVCIFLRLFAVSCIGWFCHLCRVKCADSLMGGLQVLFCSINDAIYPALPRQGICQCTIASGNVRETHDSDCVMKFWVDYYILTKNPMLGTDDVCGLTCHVIHPLAFKGNWQWKSFINWWFNESFSLPILAWNQFHFTSNNNLIVSFCFPTN